LKHLLDDPENISAIDRSGMLKTQISMPEACANAIELTRAFLERADVQARLQNRPSCLVVAGMGGSAIGGEILQDWILDSSPMPVYISRNYSLPAFPDSRSLVIAISYSGDTEETLSAFAEAQSRRLRTLSITSGGRLQRLSLEYQVPTLVIPSGMVPRAALPYLFIPLILTYRTLIKKPGFEEELMEMLSVIEKTRLEVSPQVPVKRNPAKQLALKLFHTVPIIYASSGYTGVAFRMKTLFNENSKMPSYTATLPEAFHNDVMGYEAPKTLLKPFSVLLLRDPCEDPRIKARINIAKRIMEPTTKFVHEIWVQGQTRLAKILSILYLGDVTSTYVAILNGVDPSSTETISKIKAASAS